MYKLQKINQNYCSLVKNSQLLSILFQILFTFFYKNQQNVSLFRKHLLKNYIKFPHNSLTKYKIQSPKSILMTLFLNQCNKWTAFNHLQLTRIRQYTLQISVNLIKYYFKINKINSRHLLNNFFSHQRKKKYYKSIGFCVCSHSIFYSLSFFYAILYSMIVVKSLLSLNCITHSIKHNYNKRYKTIILNE